MQILAIKIYGICLGKDIKNEKKRLDINRYDEIGNKKSRWDRKNES